MNAAGRLLRVPGLLWILTAPLAAQSARPLAVGAPAPAFALPTLAGDTATLVAQRGHPVVLNFWASWCPPCSVEMPELIAAQSRYAGDSLRIIAVNLTSQESLRDVRKFIEKYHVPFPVPLDRKGRLASVYGLISLPMTVLVDRSGVVRFVQDGPLPPAILDARLRELVSMP